MGKEIIWDLKIDFPTNGSINYLEEKIVGWFKIFSSLYWVKYVTTKLCKIVAYFNQQGIDKIMMWLPIVILDSLTTEVLLLYDNFFKGNIKFNFWKQLGMKGWNSHHCSKCSISGHSIKTCTKQCKHCNHQTCCSHLIIWEGKLGPKCCTGSSQSYLDNIYHILSSDVSNYITETSDDKMWYILSK